jgi:hypothetical protein
MIDWSQPDEGFDWAHRFDDAARAILTERPANALSLTSHRDFVRSAPTPDSLPAAIVRRGPRSGREATDEGSRGRLHVWLALDDLLHPRSRLSPRSRGRASGRGPTGPEGDSTGRHERLTELADTESIRNRAEEGPMPSRAPLPRTFARGAWRSPGCSSSAPALRLGRGL